MQRSSLKSGITPGISEEDFFATDRRPFPYGVHLAAVEVDKETGKIKVLDYLVTEDCRPEDQSDDY